MYPRVLPPYCWALSNYNLPCKNVTVCLRRSAAWPATTCHLQILSLLLFAQWHWQAHIFCCRQLKFCRWSEIVCVKTCTQLRCNGDTWLAATACIKLTWQGHLLVDWTCLQLTVYRTVQQLKNPPKPLVFLQYNLSPIKNLYLIQGSESVRKLQTDCQLLEKSCFTWFPIV